MLAGPARRIVDLGSLGARSAGLLAIGAAIVLSMSAARAASPKYDWPQFDMNAAHTGVDASETTISAANVSHLKRAFAVRLVSPVDGPPIYLSNVQTLRGPKDVLYFTSKSGMTFAVDAHTGQTIWARTFPAGTCRINRGRTICYTTSSPAIDPRRTYVYSYGLDGYVHRFAVGNGAEVRTGGWPERVTLKPWDEKESPALGIATVPGGASYLYVANGGYPGDAGDYQGHLTTINLATGAQHVFNTLCSARADTHLSEPPGSPTCAQVQSAVWARPGAVYDATTGRTYIATGNGDYDPQAGDWGDSVLALNPNGSGVSGGPVDSYTPANYQQLDDLDLDLGSTAPAILPAVPGSAIAHLAVMGGKDAKLRLLNLDDLSGTGAPGNTGGEIGNVTPVPQGGQVLTQPATWADPSTGAAWAFVSTSHGIAGLQVAADADGTPQLQPRWTVSGGGTSPIIANGVLYYEGNSGVRALDPTTGSTLWSDQTVTNVHWQSPIVDNGTLYVPDNLGNLRAYNLTGTIAVTR